jgi:8-oxo-dGTP pyrophosphatase MutT (NUDIX family)
VSPQISARDLRRVLSARRPVHRAADNRASVAVVLAAEQNNTYLLLIRRSEHPHDPWSGHMALPGGHHEPVDVNDLATAVREVKEEVGLELDLDYHLVGRLDDVEATTQGQRVGLVVTPFVFFLPRLFPLCQSAEVGEFLWAPLDKLLDGSFATTHEVLLPEGPVTLPGWRIGNRLVWGLTYRMVDSLLVLLQEE